MKKLIAIFFVLSGIVVKAQFNPSIHVTVNDAIGQSQQAPIEGRGMYWDATNFKWRDFQSTAEVLATLPTNANRFSHFPVWIHVGGTLSGGVWTGGISQCWFFKDGLANGNLVRWYTDSTGGSFFAIANNLSEGNPTTIKTNLSLQNVDNTSDATKNSASVSLTNHNINGNSNTITNIGNSSLTNNSIGLGITSNAASDISVTTSPAALGTSLGMNFPDAGLSQRGPLKAIDFAKFNNKIDSVRISNDSVYNCVNGTCTLQSIIVGGGSVVTVNNIDGSLIFSPTTGNVKGSINVANSNTWTGQQIFNSSPPIFGTLTTNGGIFYGNAGGTLLQSGAGTNNQLFKSTGGITPPIFFTPGLSDVNGWLGYTPLSNSLGSTHLFVGNASNVATDVALSGDATISNTGALTIKKPLVDTIFRIPGVDSIYYTIKGIQRAILDSAGGAGGSGDSGIIARFGINVNALGLHTRIVSADTSASGLSLYYLRILDSTFGYVTPKKLNDSLLARVIHVTTSTIRLRKPDFNSEQIYLDDPARNGFFQYDNTDAVSVDDSSMVFVTTGGARYKRVISFNFLSVKWFGAVGDGATDDIYPIQKAANWVMNNPSTPRTILFPAGTYNISGPILLAKLVSAQFAQVTVNLIGPTRTKDASAGYALIHTTFNNTFAVGIQKGKGCLIKDLAFDGIFDFPNTLNPIQIDTLKFSQWTDGSARDSLYSPYSGIVIDPFSDSTGYLSNSGMYPGLHQYCPAGLSRGGTTDVLLDNVQIKNFIIGLMITPSNQQNGEEINMVDCNIGGNKVGWASGQAQTKECHVDRFMCWDPEHTIFDNQTYGFRRGNGGGQVYVNGGNIANGVFQLGNIHTVDFICTFKNIYSEGLFKLGFMGGGSGCNFTDCDFNFTTENPGIPYPDMFIYGGAGHFVDTKLNLLGGVVPRIILAGTNNTYIGGVISSPPYVESIDGNINSVSYPSFSGITMNTGGTLGDVKAPSYFNHLQSGDPSNLGPIYTGNTYQFSSFNDGGPDVNYIFKYNGSYDRTMTIGTSPIVTNKSTWTAFFKLQTATDTGILRVNDMILTSSVPLWDQNSTVTALSYPIGFISSIGHDTVYVKNLAIGIKDSTYTIYAAYWQRPKAALTGDVVAGNAFISKSQSSGGAITSAYAVGDRLDLPQFKLGTYITKLSNDTVYLSQTNTTGSSYTDYTWMNGFPEISIYSSVNPQQLIASGFQRSVFGGAKYYRWRSTIPLISSNTYVSQKTGNLTEETFLIQNSVFLSDTSKHKFKYYSLLSKTQGQTVSIGTTANRLAGSYLVTGNMQVNSDSTDNGFPHLTVFDGSNYRQVAYKGDLAAQTLTYTQLALNNTLAINPGNSQTFLTATASLAGLLDTSRAKTIDSLKNRTITGFGGSGISRISPIDSLAKSANGIQVSGVSLVPQSVDASFPGLVTTGTQTFAGVKTMPFPKFNGTPASAGTNDSAVMWNPSTNQLEVRTGTINLTFSNGLKVVTTGDSIIRGGGLNQNTSTTGGGFTISEGTSGSHLGGFSIYSDGGTTINNGKYQSAQGSQILGAASTINNAVTSASGSVSNFSAYAFLAPTITSTNTGVTYSNPATLRIDNSPTMSTNSTATGSLYALDVAAGYSHFGVGSSAISAMFAGSVSVNTSSGNVLYGLNIGASTTSQYQVSMIPGVDPSGSVSSGDFWYNGTNLNFGDGTGIKRDILNGLHNYRHTIFTPTTGGTVALVNNQYNIINPAGALVAITLNLPSSPANNDVVYIKFTQTVSTVTYANGTVVDGITAPTAGGIVILTFDSGSTSWY